MNKLLKYFLGVFIIGIGIVNTTNANTVTTYTQIELLCDNGSCNSLINAPSQPFIIKGNENIEIYCQIAEYWFSENDTNITDNQLTIGIQGITPNTISYKEMELTDNGNGFEGNITINYEEDLQDTLYGEFNTGYNASYLGLGMYPHIDNNSKNGTLFLGCILSGNVYSTIEEISGNNNQSCPSCPTCEEQYTSLECQTEYNLIPINDVNENYCKLNFDLIEPTECPGIGEGTGEINRTARYINNVQYPGTASLRIDIADFLEYSTTYNSGETLVDIIGVDADEDYINNIIDKEQLTPTKDDFAYLISNLGDYIPLLAIAGLMIRAWRIIKKVF